MILTEAYNPFYTDVIVEQDILDEAQKDKLPKGAIMTFNAKVGHAGKITANGRYYSKNLMKREVNRLQESIKGRRVEGLYGHPLKALGGTPDPARAAFLVTGLTMNEQGETFLKGNIYDTTSGRDMAARVRAGAKVGFSARGGGTSEKVVLTDKHEAYADESNRAWSGKEIEHVNEDYHLKTYDQVIGQAIGDAEIKTYMESMEENMSFDIKKLTDENWKEIVESEKIKKLIEESENKAYEVVKKETAEYIESGKFLDENEERIVEHLVSQLDEEDQKALEELFSKDDNGMDEALVKCAECGASIPPGGKFCPACGAAAPVAKKESEEPKDEATKELLKRLEESDKRNAQLTEAVEALQKDKKDREDTDAVAEIIESVLVGKPKLIVEAVMEDLAERDLTPKNAKEIVEKRLAFTEAFIEKTGGKLDDGGKGKTGNGDKELEPKNEAEEKALDMLDSLLD